MSLRALMNIAEAADDLPPSVNEMVFVYGSLKRGFGNHHVIASGQFVGVGRTPPRFDLLDLGAFPAAIPGKHMMSGEVYEVDPATMAKLDRLESNGVMYQRKKVPILIDGKQIPAWTYIYLADDGMDELVAPIGNTVTWTHT